MPSICGKNTLFLDCSTAQEVSEDRLIVMFLWLSTFSLLSPYSFCATPAFLFVFTFGLNKQHREGSH